MATFMANDYSVVINSVDLSDHVKNVSLDYSAEELDDTAMGDNTRSAKSGLKVWGFSVEFLQDHAAGNVDATLFPLIGGAGVFCTIKPTSSAVAATNPSYSGTAICTSYPPLTNSVGDLANTTATFKAAKSDLARNTS